VPEDFHPGFTATGIGSLPHADPATAVADVLSRLTEMPYWPQLPNRDAAEDMNLQYAPALEPLVAPDLARRELKAFGGQSREEALAGFYERLMGGDTGGFGLSEASAAGMFEFMRQVQAAPADAYPWIKGHVTGPLTLAASAMGGDGKAILYDDEVAEAAARGLGVAAAAQVDQLAPLGRPVMMFLDEPFLSGFGSAFTPVSRERVMELIGFTLEELRARAEAVVGVHCCGNTDWAMLIEAGADVINLDSAGFGEHLLLYPEAVNDLMARGGAVAWGAVPTSEYTGDETGQGLWEHLRGILQGLESKGLDRGLIASQSLLTPACGMGSLDEAKARAILDLTAEVSRLARAEYAA
jgi:methionine synthase II (cobalamin-independent)